MNSQLAVSGLAFTSSTSIVQGNFNKPDTILDTVRMSRPTANGIIVITAKHVSGRIGVSNNCLIVGAIVDGTGETGMGAVYKLLLVPFGTFNFRQEVPQEQWHIQQDLNLHIHEVKTSLAGPSSIGLARPADVSLTKLPALPQVNVPESKTPLQNVQDLNVKVANYTRSADSALATGNTNIINNSIASSNQGEEIFEEYVQSRRTIQINNYEQTISSTFVADCNKLLDSVEKKQSETKEMVRPRRTTLTDLQTLKNVPEPTPKKSNSTHVSLVAAAAIAAALGCMAVAGLVNSTAPNPSSSTMDSTADFMTAASAHTYSSTTSTSTAEADSDSLKDETTTSANMKTPIFTIANSQSQPASPNHTTYILPGAGPINSSPPPVEPSTAEESDSKNGTTLDSLLEKSKNVDTKNLMFWVQSVKRNPNDAVAREHLAYQLLAHNQAKVAVQQFQAMMILRNPDTQEIIKFADALVFYDEKRLAQQFLTNIAAADPSKTEVLQKLALLK
jgi:hypothetical protein